MTKSNGNDKQKANAPVYEVRLGAIKAAIWSNETKNGSRHSVRITRLYKDGDEWRTSDTFGRDDLPLVEKVADMAHAWIFSNANRQSAHTETEQHSHV